MRAKSFLAAAYYARDVGNCRLLYLSPDGCGSNVELSAEQLAWLQQLERTFPFAGA